MRESLVATISFVRVLISFKANLDWLLYQLDVKNVFLHGDLLYGGIHGATAWVCCLQWVSGQCVLADGSIGHGSRSFLKFLDRLFSFPLHTDVRYILVYVDEIVIIGDDS
jgi:hypothetical protein